MSISNFDINQMVNGWKNVMFKDEGIEKLAAQRSKVCAQCQHNRKLVCGLCGCPLPAKLRSEQASCPIQRW